MSEEFLPFAKPSISEEAIAEVVACLRSGWITTGPRLQKFEEMLTEYHSGRRAICLSSATAGLQLALLALELEDGDEVITTPLTFAATLNTIVLAGAKPVLVDIDSKTLNINTAKIEEKITPKTRAIMPVHFAGLPVDLDEIYALAKKHNLLMVEDCAHAIGAEYKGRKLCSFGDVQVMSFHPNKNMTTGEGGAVIANDAELISKIEKLRFHGIDRNAFNRFSKAGSQDYDVVLAGYKYNMMDLQAALGIHQLPSLDSFIEKRTKLAENYLKEFADFAPLILPEAPSYSHRHAWHLFTVRISEKAKISRDEFIVRIKEKNIGVGLHYKSAHVFSFYAQNYGFAPHDFPESLKAGETICSLPLFPDMKEEEQARVVQAVREILS